MVIPHVEQAVHLIQKLTVGREINNMNTKVLDQYHDATLLGINTDDINGSCSLSFKLNDGEGKEILLNGCEIIRVVDYINQNIVSRVVVYQGGFIDRGDVATKLTWASELSDASSYLKQEALMKVVERIAAGDACLIYLEPSSGAEVVALCAKVVERSMT